MLLGKKNEKIFSEKIWWCWLPETWNVCGMSVFGANNWTIFHLTFLLLGTKTYRREITFINLGSAELISRGMHPNGEEAVDAWLSPGAQLWAFRELTRRSKGRGRPQNVRLYWLSHLLGGHCCISPPGRYKRVRSGKQRSRPTHARGHGNREPDAPAKC